MFPIEISRCGPRISHDGVSSCHTCVLFRSRLICFLCLRFQRYTTCNVLATSGGGVDCRGGDSGKCKRQFQGGGGGQEEGGGRFLLSIPEDRNVYARRLFQISHEPTPSEGSTGRGEDGGSGGGSSGWGGGGGHSSVIVVRGGGSGGSNKGCGVHHVVVGANCECGWRGTARRGSRVEGGCGCGFG